MDPIAAGEEMGWLTAGSATWSQYAGAAIAAAWVLCLWAIRQGRARRAQSWPTTEGTVESAQIRVEGVGDDRREIPEVSYSYCVEGEYYAGYHVVRGARQLEAYSPGSRVLVHYKRIEPAESFLDRQDLRNRRGRVGSSLQT